MGHGLVVGGDVHHNLLVRHNVRTVLIDQFLMGGGAMHAGGDQNAHARLRGGGMDAAQQDGHGDFRGDGAGVVGANDHDVALVAAQLLKRG